MVDATTETPMPAEPIDPDAETGSAPDAGAAAEVAVAAPRESDGPAPAVAIRHGGDLVAEVLQRHGVRSLFTLCGGHISPILTAAEERGIRILDVRDEASAAFAADATSRLTGTPGVAAVTAGPGLTNTITAVKNAQLAQSPLVVLGGATGTFLKGRGSLQDIDQQALMAPHVKWQTTCSRVRELPAAIDEAMHQAADGVPGPVFVECPVDLLYAEELVAEQYGVGPSSKRSKSLVALGVQLVLKRHVTKLFAGWRDASIPELRAVEPAAAGPREVAKLAKALRKARRPVLLVGSQATLDAGRIERVAAAVERLGLPTYLSGMARGLLGAEPAIQLRHKRRDALRDADLVLLAGVPADFRLDYGRHVPRSAQLVSINRSAVDLTKNRKPDLGILADPGATLVALAERFRTAGRRARSRARWVETLRARDAAREADIARRAEVRGEHVNPLHLCREIDALLDDDSVLVADGGDFVATASYTIRPRGPLRWLDPGVFGTLGVGGGFALGAKAARPTSEVWLLWGDGSAAYSLAEFDAFARHGLPVIAVIGNDAGWTQIAREQVEILGSATGTVLAHSAYFEVARGYGGEGIRVETMDAVRPALLEAKRLARSGRPVVVDVVLDSTDFRKGSISM
ncbi:MAG: thiamine pyrophosphate-binding protein [Acidobacteriota bacterium]